jgi:pyruvate formate lyase activating enzyme
VQGEGSYRNFWLEINVGYESVGLDIKKGIVFEVKRFAIDDGPGIRTTIFLKGCPLHCWWCHNPEGQALAPELMYRSMRCTGCNECVKICAKAAISCVGESMAIDREKCNLCGRCCQKCPTEALAIVGKEMSLNEVLKEIDKDLIFYGESEGGVTVSGGEPLSQLTFLNSLLDECKGRGIQTAVDTCGYAPYKSIDKISNRADLFLYDIKIIDEKKHRKYTGVSNKTILQNFKKLTDKGSNIQVRFPVIPGINDSEENVTKTAEFLVSCGTKNISLLPYHRSGIEKYTGLGRTYKLGKTKSPSDQDMRKIKEALEIFGLNVRVGGG